MIRTVLFLAAALALITGCAHQSANVPAQPSGFVLVREYVDAIKSETGDQYQKVQYGWDYDSGVAVKKSFELDGTAIAVEDYPGQTLSTSASELEYAFALVRVHPQLRAASERADAKMYGGFAFRNGEGGSVAERYCRAKSRCLHVMISAGRAGEVFLGHAIVDLASGKVVDPNYDAAVKNTQLNK